MQASQYALLKLTHVSFTICFFQVYPGHTNASFITCCFQVKPIHTNAGLTISLFQVIPMHTNSIFVMCLFKVSPMHINARFIICLFQVILCVFVCKLCAAEMCFSAKSRTYLPLNPLLHNRCHTLTSFCFCG